MSIIDAIDQLKSYDGPEEITLHKGADDVLLLEVERVYGVKLPNDLKEFYKFSNGFETPNDMFNMIPLVEITENKGWNGYKDLFIAEYMIYADMWWLEVNPTDHNDYKIIAESNNNKLVLTNSLSEFIRRFLQGGVFGPGGLYDWHEEVELQPIYSTKLKTAESLLTFFYYGLIYNIISKEEVINWADRLVMHENEPDLFFIEISLSHEKKTLLDLLSSIRMPESSVAARAMLGLLYHRLCDGIIDMEKAISVINKHNFSNALTGWEMSYVYDFNEISISRSNDEKVKEKILNFLSHYKQFEISNYKNWFGFDIAVKMNFLKK